MSVNDKVGDKPSVCRIHSVILSVTDSVPQEKELD
jgi:hypothetical protein